MGEDEKPGASLDIRSEFEAWRRATLNALLAVAVVVGIPLTGVIIAEVVNLPGGSSRQLAAAIGFPSLYLFVVILVLFRRLGFRLRAWGLLVITYIAGLSALLHGGLGGDGRLYLLILPILGFIFFDLRTGLIMAALSLLTFVGFGLLVGLGGVAEAGDSLALISWMVRSAAFAAAIVGLMALQWRFVRFMESSALDNVRLYEQAQHEITERGRVERGLRQRNRELRLLNRVGQAWGSTLDLDQVLVMVLEEVRGLLDVAAAAVWLTDSETGELSCRQATGPQGDAVRGWRLAVGEGIAGWVARDGESVIVSDTRSDDRYFPGVEEQTGMELRSILAVPMRLKQDVIGALQVADTAVDRFDQADLALLEPLAASAAIAIENARLYEEIQRELTERRRAEAEIRQRTAQLEALRQVGLELTAQLDLDTLLHFIVSRAMDLLGGDKGSFYLYRSETDDLRLVVLTSSSVDLLGTRLRRGEGLAGRVLETARPLIVDDYHPWEGQMAVGADDPIPAVVGVPVRWGEEFLGVLIVQAFPDRAFEAADVELLGLFATQAAIAVKNARLFVMERRRTTQLAAVAQVAEQITDILSLDEVMHETVQLIVEAFGYPYASIMLLDGTSDELVFTAGAGGYEGWTPPGFRQNLGEGMIGWAASVGKTILANDVSRDPHYIPAYLTETKSELDVPLKYHDRIVGVLDLQSTELNAFSEHDVMAMETLAGHIAAAIENARLYEQAQHEIAERKRAEGALRDSEEMAQALLNATTESVFLTDAQGRILALNQTANRRIGKESDQVIGSQIQAWLSLDGADGNRSVIEQVASTRRPVRFEMEQRGALFDTSIYPIFAANGEVTRLAVFAQDITGRKKAERQAAQAERLAAIGRLAAGLAHEINNPLQSIRSNLELITDFDLAPEERRHYLPIIYQEFERLTTLTRRVLEFARPPAQSRHACDVTELIDSTLILLGKQFQRAGVHVQLDCPSNLSPIYVVPDQIVQVLLNVIINAIEAMPEGGHLDISARDDGGVMRLVFVNDGPSLSRKQIEYIFDPFFTTKPDGTGLGLSVSHSIIQQHGGTITAENRPHDQGVVFTITLPLADR